MNQINAVSPLFREIVLFYINSHPGSFNEAYAINYIVKKYSFKFKQGGKSICYIYLDAFFDELIRRGNSNHIKEIKEMFGGISVDKSKNEIYQRFIIILLNKLKNK